MIETTHPYPERRDESDKPDPKYHWKADESVSEGLQRIVRGEFELATWQLSKNLDLDESVHEARKCLKKIRSAMRLFQKALPGYDQENAALRDAGRKLSPVRDAEALIQIFDELNDKHREELGDRSLAVMREGLVNRKEQLEQDFGRKHVRGKVLKTLRESAGRVDKWNWNGIDAASLSRGFAATIRRNRKACRAAYADSDPLAFHEWRKRAKDLRYHLGLLGKIWPPVLEGYEAAAAELEQNLGEDHNLVVLREVILEKPDHFGQEEDISAFLKILDDRQKKLRSESKTMADRLYSEGPRQWRRRLKNCWAAWQKE